MYVICFSINEFCKIKDIINIIVQNITWIKNEFIKKVNIYFVVPFSLSNFTACLYQNNKLKTILISPVVMKGVVKRRQICR